MQRRIKRPKKQTTQDEFWVTNVTDRNVMLSDLRLSIKARTTVNLLDAKHYPWYTREMLEKSAASGSLKVKEAYIRVRQMAPDPPARRALMIEKNAALPMLPRSQVRIDEPYYEELDMTPEQAQVEYAAETADMDFEDRAPAGIVVDKKYKEDE